MAGKQIKKWLDKWNHFLFHIKEEPVMEYRAEAQYEFSPMTYQNPYIPCMYQIIRRVLEKRNILCQHLKLVFIDGDTEQDDDDIQTVLSQFDGMLNYLLLVTDRPSYYKHFTDAMFEENGLIVQQISKNRCRNVCGNMILDFGRSENIPFACRSVSSAIYIPIYKRPWDICENLDIIVPVGYNTLVVDGIQLQAANGSNTVQEILFEDKLDRLDREFRKG